MPDDISWMLGGAAALLTGWALGAIFFGGLWWTVQLGAASPTPSRWFVSSLILRTGIVLAGFYLIGADQPALLGLCLLGFITARALILRITRDQPDKAAPGKVQASGKPPCA
ncbi:ATP synthase subunit I [Pseudomonas neustonica]|uniref:ATP synthase subunit I n=1 Tax=Pseudomonas neustonica TaxID=2487346 RepID=A0ABX9XLV9_9PSED|nr:MULTISPECIES: ATP synthase subunit I [Pseudomonas]ROZ84184.1 ATP synthase subunit I [Pseudomonas sp. SSM44]ROZ84431.1 ATP synthase subunit I [Pseudomonas neustonica]|tara:strand:- start:9913 stop:10248 length:336 start_codon:yes stop_codon:yes gene_type:complete